MQNIIIIADSRGRHREDFICTAEKNNKINNLLLSLECKINGKYYDALDLLNDLKRESSHSTEKSLYEKDLDSLHLSDTISLGGIFLYHYLCCNGYKVDYISNYYNEKDKLKECLTKAPLAVLISSTFLNIKQLIEIITYVEKENEKVPIIVGGQLIDYLGHFQQYLFEFNKKIFKKLLFIWDARGEYTLLRTLNALKNERPIDSIPNLIFYRKDKIIKTEKIEETQDIDHHIIRWDDIDNQYLRKYVPVQTSAGCPFKCTFCTFAKLHRKIKLKSIKALEKELLSISKKEKIKHVMFVDDLVAITKKRLQEITDMIYKNKFPFTWSALLRSDSITDATLVKRLKESGLVLANLGIESFDKNVLNNMNKKTTPEHHFKAIKLLKNEDIFVNGFFVFGFPGETKSSIQRTIDGIIQSEIDLCEIHLWNNVPGAPIFDSKSFNLKGGYMDWSHNSMNSKQAIKHITEVFKKISPQFGMTDDNVLPLVLMLANGYSNSQIKNIYKTKSQLVLNQHERNYGKLTDEEYKKNQEKLLTTLRLRLSS